MFNPAGIEIAVDLALNRSDTAKPAARNLRSLVVGLSVGW
jgi:hypothetical protein